MTTNTSRRPAVPADPSQPLVLIVHLEGDNYERAVDAANDLGGSTSAVVEYLSRWDYGDENDTAAPYNGGLTTLSELEGLPHQLHPVAFGGLDYWLQLDHGLRFYALYRAPLAAGALLDPSAQRKAR